MTRGTVCDFFFTKLRPEKYHTMGSRTMRNRPPQVLNRTRKRGERASGPALPPCAARCAAGTRVGIRHTR